MEKILCKEVMNHICDSLGEDLDSPKCTSIKTHLEECPNCQKYFKSIESTIQFYKKYNVELSIDKHKKLLSVLGLDDVD